MTTLTEKPSIRASGFHGLGGNINLFVGNQAKSPDHLIAEALADGVHCDFKTASLKLLRIITAIQSNVVMLAVALQPLLLRGYRFVFISQTIGCDRDLKHSPTARFQDAMNFLDRFLIVGDV